MTKINLNKLLLFEVFENVTLEILDKGPFTNYVYKRRGGRWSKKSTFCKLLFHRKCKWRGVGGQKKPNLLKVACERPIRGHSITMWTKCYPIFNWRNQKNLELTYLEFFKNSAAVCFPYKITTEKLKHTKEISVPFTRFYCILSLVNFNVLGRNFVTKTKFFKNSGHKNSRLHYLSFF
jgi:hypothetical protein